MIIKYRKHNLSQSIFNDEAVRRKGMEESRALLSLRSSLRKLRGGQLAIGVKDTDAARKERAHPQFAD